MKAGDIIKDKRATLAKVNWIDLETQTAGITYIHPAAYVGGSNVVSLDEIERKDLDFSKLDKNVLREAIAKLRDNRAKAQPVELHRKKTSSSSSSTSLDPETLRLLKEAGFKG